MKRPDAVPADQSPTRFTSGKVTSELLGHLLTAIGAWDDDPIAHGLLSLADDLETLHAADTNRVDIYRFAERCRALVALHDLMGKDPRIKAWEADRDAATAARKARGEGAA